MRALQRPTATDTTLPGIDPSDGTGFGDDTPAGPSPAARRPPGSLLPAGTGVPAFAPVRPRGGRHRLRRLLHGRRRLAALALAAAAGVLALLVPGTDVRAAPPAPVPPPPAAREGPDDRRVSVPVRVADPAVARLVGPGDRVDVLAASDAAGQTPGPATVVARRVLVAEVPEAAPGDVVAGPGGTLLVLSVSPGTAADLAGAAAAAELAVARW
ncbi:RcpC/CpaB family pilus assembly protein [Streptomyces sp. NPDC049881]|uniref:RcpC/CpaB family pilus assembly protein n=1 Tax=Streptomyces sp. NPDC049881 TaxID=3155778 RepID=UPI0034481D78